MADCLIAGIALAEDEALLTRNRRHFERVPGLRLVDLGEVHEIDPEAYGER
jgi:tRNA(fMet)-specific endonuclease VapC